MRWAWLLLLCACDSTGQDAADGAFRPIGAKDTGVETDAGAPASPLRLVFEEIPHDTGALRITDFVFAARDRVIAIDKDGWVHALDFDGERLTRTGGFEVPGVWFDSDAGLISLALDPDFATNRYLYLGFTTDRETSVIHRYTWDPTDWPATQASARPILELRARGAPRSWHNVGSIGFEPDGVMWALFGDKVLDQFALDPDSILGSLVRIIPDRTPDGAGYTTPPDNPYADGSGDPAVYAKGFRSPWKGVYHQGRWFVGDIGLDDWEEVNLVEAPGQSFGWPEAEGVCTADCEGHVDPWVFFGRGSRQPYVREDPDATASRLRSVWVGLVYEPNDNDRYQGRFDDVLLFGDFFVGFVRGRRADGTGESWPVGHLVFASAFRQAPDGYVYASAFGTWPVEGPVNPTTFYRAVLAE